MTFGAEIASFFDSPAGQAVAALVVLGLADLLLGVFAAVRDNVFSWEAIDAWVRSQLAGRILPIAAILILGHIAGGISFDDGTSGVLSVGGIITGGGLVAAGLYVITTAASLLESLQPKPGTREVPEE